MNRENIDNLYQHYVEKEIKFLSKLGDNPEFDIKQMFLSSSCFQRGLLDLIMNRNYSKVKQFFYTGGLLYLFQILKAKKFTIGTLDYCKILLCGNNELLESIFIESKKADYIEPVFLFNYILSQEWEIVERLLTKKFKYIYPNSRLIEIISYGFIENNSDIISKGLNELNSKKLVSIRSRDAQTEKYISLLGLVIIEIANKLKIELDIIDSELIPMNFLKEEVEQYAVPYRYLFNFLNEQNVNFELKYNPGQLIKYDKSS